MSTLRKAVMPEDPPELPCPRCGQPVDCGMRAGRQTCWCFDLPRTMAVPEREAGGETCLCEACLREVIIEADVSNSGPERDGGQA